MHPDGADAAREEGILRDDVGPLEGVLVRTESQDGGQVGGEALVEAAADEAPVLHVTRALGVPLERMLIAFMGPLPARADVADGGVLEVGEDVIKKLRGEVQDAREGAWGGGQSMVLVCEKGAVGRDENKEGLGRSRT
ncbi:hypothetical protein IMZ48_22640 [Candidatus Bathyarchaeota archaeon]|nr:hypothetical protein [Candidatus Bathyarchaeota archaeon]